MPRSGWGANVSVSVALLLKRLGSVTPAGGATLAVLERVPVAPAATVPESVYVAVPPTARLTVSLMLPAPLALQLDPGDAEQVQVAPSSELGRTSVTVAPATPSGPASETTIVYVSGAPGTANGWPSVLVTARSAPGPANSRKTCADPALAPPGVSSWRAPATKVSAASDTE